MPKRILIYDDPRSDLQELHEAFERATQGKSHIVIERDERCLASLLDRRWELIVLDYGAAGRTGKDQTIQAIRECDPDLPIVVIVPANPEVSQFYLAAGATDFLVFGPGFHQLLIAQMQKIDRWIQLIERNRSLQAANQEFELRANRRYHMVGKSQAIKDVLHRIERVARIPRPVLICGERGTGKELVARAIHEEGGKKRPLVTVNCAAFSDELLESELFGHEKGAFTGAADRHRGKFEQANGGTLFLDEIGHMSIGFQKKILRAVEYGTFRRVGGSEEITVKTRVIAATNANLRERIAQGTFLSDLYDRLAFEVIDIPPLRARKQDIELLANFFMDRFMEEVPSFRGKVLSASAKKTLLNYQFPGNIRELKNIIERAVYRDTTNEITPHDLSLMVRLEDYVEGTTFKDKMASFERRLILDAMERAQFNQAEAARLLGLSYHQFRYYWQKYADHVKPRS